MTTEAPAGRPEAPEGPPAYLAPGERQSHQPTGAVIHDALTFSSLNGYRPLDLDLYVPESRTGLVPCVVWVHGGAWLFGSRQILPDNWSRASVFQYCIDAGLAVASIDYRHSREASFPAQTHDAFAALRWLRAFGPELGVDPERIAVWGDSAGAHLASLVGLITDPELQGADGPRVDPAPIRAVVSFYGVADVDTMPDFLASLPEEWAAELIAAAGGLPPAPIDVLLRDTPYPAAEARRLVSPVHHVTPTSPPFLLIHGDADGMVPVDQSRQLHAALVAAGAEAELVIVPGADHVFVGTDATPQLERAIDFLRERL